MRMAPQHAAPTPAAPAPQQSVQKKARIGPVDDPLEREADRIADAVVSGRPAGAMSGAGSDAVQRKCEACEAEEEKTLRRKSAGGDIAASVEAASADKAAAAVSGGGALLTPAQRAYFEPRFGHDFSQVRLHDNVVAGAAARSINARAYTLGREIAFAPGEYAPGTAAGRWLLAHELTHVVQQSAEHVSGAAARQPAGTGVLQRKDDPKNPPKAPTCDTGCAQRWGQDTTCSKWGEIEPSPEAALEPPWAELEPDAPHQEPLICCNTWPLSLELSARQEGLNGAASCTANHQREIATVTFKDKSVSVLCTDTIPKAQFKPKPISPTACTDEVMNKERVGGKKVEVLEMSPTAMKDLSGQLDHALPVSVCYSGVKKDDLCQHRGPLPHTPKIEECLSEGCSRPLDPPTHAKSGWPRA